jgi:hypothetical protein
VGRRSRGRGLLRHQAVELRAAQGERAVGAGERAKRVWRAGDCRLELPGRILETDGGEGGLERRLVLEVLVQRGSADAQPLRQPAHGQGIRALCFEELQRGGDDLARPLGQRWKPSRVRRPYPSVRSIDTQFMGILSLLG